MHAKDAINDSFSVSLMLALGIHAAIILGISFALDFNPIQKAAETLDVVLVNWQSEDAPEDAEFLAEAAQQGGGESEEVQKPSQEIAPDIPSLDQGDMPVASPEVMPQPNTDAREQIVAEDPNALQLQQLTEVEQPEPPMPSAADLMQQSMQVAQIQPESVRERDFQSRLPRREFISASTREYKYATYMHAWVAKVERVGNLNYPAELKERKMSGDLMMTVGINLDGSVESISIRRGSGIPDLDAAAERIVRLAAPYSPLPADIAEDVDVLHITRTWRFSHGAVFE